VKLIYINSGISTLNLVVVFLVDEIGFSSSNYLFFTRPDQPAVFFIVFECFVVLFFFWFFLVLG